jgi:hypothetical protein
MAERTAYSIQNPVIALFLIGSGNGSQLVLVKLTPSSRSWSAQGWRQLVGWVRHPLLPYNHYHC